MIILNFNIPTPPKLRLTVAYENTFSFKKFIIYLCAFILQMSAFIYYNFLVCSYVQKWYGVKKYPLVLEVKQM